MERALEISGGGPLPTGLSGVLLAKHIDMAHAGRDREADG